MILADGFPNFRSSNQANLVVKKKSEVSDMSNLTLECWIVVWLNHYPDAYGRFFGLQTQKMRRFRPTILAGFEAKIKHILW